MIGQFVVSCPRFSHYWIKVSAAIADEKTVTTFGCRLPRQQTSMLSYVDNDRRSSYISGMRRENRNTADFSD